MTEQWIDGATLRWDSKNPYDAKQSTHLWIVARAAEVARAQADVGEYIYDLIKPQANQSDSAFHDAICRGLWDADEKDPYRNSVKPGDAWYGKLSATYKSHFYDPDTEKNWLGETTPTAMTEGVRFFNQALDAYIRGDIRQAGYAMGLSLHYLTDVTQPMHAANFTAIDPAAPLYHGAYETFAIEVQQEVTITAAYHDDNLGTDPAAHIKAAAVTAKRRYPEICSEANLDSWNKEGANPSAGWKQSVKPQIIGALQEAVASTAQYLVNWMKQAFLKQNVSASLIQTQNQGFDTVVALTQQTINLKLSSMFEAGIIQPTLKLDLPDDYGKLSAQLMAPTIRIHTSTQENVTDPHTVLFILHFTEGTLSTWTGFGPNAKRVEIPFSAGDIGFRVNLNFEAAEQADASDAVKAAVAQLKNLGLEIFSMQQLVMDLQNANLAAYEPESTTLPLELANDAIFITILEKYFSELHANGINVLGYAITVPTPTNTKQPSFPPTDLTFGTHIHEPAAGQKSNHNLDALYYLVMNQQHPFPPNNPLPKGNFIDLDQPDIDGRMAIARSIFVDQFLIPHLASAVTLRTDLTQTGERKVSLQTRAGVGSFTPKNDEWQYSVEQPITWGSHEGAGNTFPSDITWKVAHDCNVTILVGTGLISVSGTSSIYNEVECWAGIKYHAMSEDVWVKATINWGLEITLQPLSGSGALEAKTVWHISDPVTKNGGDFLGQFEHVVNPNVDREAASLAKTLTSLLVNANIQARVNQVLSGYNAFFFPGANTFDFYNPVFNANRDLIATITIRGL